MQTEAVDEALDAVTGSTVHSAFTLHVQHSADTSQSTSVAVWPSVVTTHPVHTTNVTFTIQHENCI